MTSRSEGDAVRAEGAVPFWVTRRAARVVLVAVHAAAAAVVLLEVIVPFPKDSHAVERVAALDFTASYAIYGFVACVVLVLMGVVLRRLVIRPESYYGKESVERLQNASDGETGERAGRAVTTEPRDA